MAKPKAKKPVAKSAKTPKTVKAETVITAPKPKAAPRVAMSAEAAVKAQELLDQILAYPEDRSVRLIYADLLGELGDPRGEFIVQHCALADLDPLDARYPAALASVRRTEVTYGRSWFSDYAKRTKLGPEDSPRADFDRNLNARFSGGMLQRIAMRPEDIAAEWPRLRAREPIEGIELLAGEGLMSDHKTLREPADFTVLKITPSGWFTSHSVADVLAWGMPKLRVLELSGCDLGVRGAQLIANQDTDLGEHDDEYRKPPPFADGQLEELSLSGGGITDEGARLVFAAPHLERLRALDLMRCGLTATSLVALREAPAMHGLRRLGLAGNNELGAQLGELAGWEALPQLEALALPQATTAAALAAMFPRPSSSLRELVLASAKELAQWPGLVGVAEALVELDIGTTSLGDDRWTALLAAPSARTLVHLHANGCSLSDAAIDALVASALDRLVTLDLSSNKLTDRGLAALAAWPGLQHVTHVRINNNRKVTEAGLVALANATQFQPARFEIGKLGDAKITARLSERFGDALVAG
jgi:uncharacterized protein (TIGR02996 family)